MTYFSLQVCLCFVLFFFLIYFFLMSPPTVRIRIRKNGILHQIGQTGRGMCAQKQPSFLEIILSYTAVLTFSLTTMLYQLVTCGRQNKLCRFLLVFPVFWIIIVVIRGVWNKALSDFWCNVKFSSSFTTGCKEIWKENLVIYQKSLKAFLQAPLHLLCEDNKITFLFVKDCDVFFLGYICNSFQGKKQVSAPKSNRCMRVSWWGNFKHIINFFFFLKTYSYFFHRLTDNLVALKEIRLEHEEGAPCTAIREG